MASLVWSRAQMSVPSTSSWPELGVSTPPRMCSNVDLPEPEEPTMATNSPFSTLKLTSSRALICVSPFPYTFERLFTLRMSTMCLQDFYNRLLQKSDLCHGVTETQSLFLLFFSVSPWLKGLYHLCPMTYTRHLAFLFTVY